MCSKLFFPLGTNIPVLVTGEINHELQMIKIMNACINDFIILLSELDIRNKKKFSIKQLKGVIQIYRMQIYLKNDAINFVIDNKSET